MELAIISGKGGTGKSCISAAFASLAEESVLADCDVDAANLYILFQPTHGDEEIFVSGQKAQIDYNLCNSCGLCLDYCRFDAIRRLDGEVIISGIRCDGCGLCARICPLNAIDMVNIDRSRMYSGSFRYGMMVYGRLAPGDENSGKLVNMVRSKAKAISKKHQLQNIIIDGPPGIGCAAISSITGVDRVLIVTEPSLTGLHDLKRVLEITTNFNLERSVIINRYDLNRHLTNQIEEYCSDIDVRVVGKIPFDRLMVDAMVNCKTIIEWAPDAEITDIIREIFYNFEFK